MKILYPLKNFFASDQIDKNIEILKYRNPELQDTDPNGPRETLFLN